MDPITPEEAVEMRRILIKWYGPAVAAWDISAEHYRLLGRLIDASDRCTAAMHLVPHPLVMADPINWVTKQVRDAVRRQLLRDDNKHYLACLSVAARNLRTPMEAAGLGL